MATLADGEPLNKEASALGHTLPYTEKGQQDELQSVFVMEEQQEIPTYWQEYGANAIRGSISAVIMAVLIVILAYLFKRLDKAKTPSDNSVYYNTQSGSVQANTGLKNYGFSNSSNFASSGKGQSGTRGGYSNAGYGDGSDYGGEGGGCGDSGSGGGGGDYGGGGGGGGGGGYSGGGGGGGDCGGGGGDSGGGGGGSGGDCGGGS
ncbi:hypothetical protein TCAL_10794 [Tigriopus californicus]|uniref:Uncharacterized protein n=2 Tax=Tigriopus californicus TaxID=6832 RepID=A0A553PPZ6_TIGCA|nr:hypothetical protein TCAL_10794 [Tigriopus californicus]|eukprot:TCALIF_10794-PA protein Name:"Protein of unknown function" AED:0.41 eAED:0.41 QI:0/0.5/0.33/0.66/1/1/3/0/204